MIDGKPKLMRQKLKNMEEVYPFRSGLKQGDKK